MSRNADRRIERPSLEVIKFAVYRRRAVRHNVSGDSGFRREFGDVPKVGTVRSWPSKLAMIDRTESGLASTRKELLGGGPARLWALRATPISSARWATSCYRRGVSTYSAWLHPPFGVHGLRGYRAATVRRATKASNWPMAAGRRSFLPVDLGRRSGAIPSWLIVQTLSIVRNAHH
jgi:hypothetical protein